MRKALQVLSLLMGMVTTGAGVVRLVDDTSAEQPLVAQTVPPPAATTTTVAAGTPCTNADAGYTITAPAGWHTVFVPGRPDTECRLFDPEPLALGPGDSLPVGAVNLETLNVDYGEWVGTFQDPSIEILDSEQLRINGRRAQFFAFHFKGEPEGTVEIVYLIDQGQPGILALATRGDHREEAGAMIRSVTFP